MCVRCDSIRKVCRLSTQAVTLPLVVLVPSGMGDFAAADATDAWQREAFSAISSTDKAHGCAINDAVESQT